MYTCIPLGTVAIGLGIYGDAHGWWDDRSFLTNLASSFASLLFGVPLALVVLTHLSAMQAEVGERRVAQRRITEAERSFVRAFQQPFPTTDVAATKSHLETLQPQISNVQDILRQIVNAAMVGVLPNSAEPFESAVQEAVRTYRKVWHASPTWAEHVVRQWSVLDEEARPLAEATGLHWLDASTVLHINKSMAELSTLRLPTPSRLELIASEVIDGIRASHALGNEVHTLGRMLEVVHDWARASRQVASLIRNTPSLAAIDDQQP
ncbi:hypothetical protein GCM10010222_80960 [Streptomyces tanashiensis]|uniref:hypothetical protein n=1 Tax=Streptomyces tanashiensis TaxID=67367 RepID=UPI00167AB07F|nr:hypothetical protein [Streptomyces tanashiensis]GGT26974.1 hypothetical protein GCM10010222_80960 [Streptomyces tanashiensis]